MAVFIHVSINLDRKLSHQSGCWRLIIHLFNSWSESAKYDGCSGNVIHSDIISKEIRILLPHQPFALITYTTILQRIVYMGYIRQRLTELYHI